VFLRNALKAKPKDKFVCFLKNTPISGEFQRFGGVLL
jgi:hypothetical protein